MNSVMCHSHLPFTGRSEPVSTSTDSYFLLHQINISNKPFTLQEMSVRSLHKNMKFSINDFFSKCDQIRRKLRIWSHLLNKSLMENFIFVQLFDFFGNEVLQFQIDFFIFIKQYLATFIHDCDKNPPPHHLTLISFLVSIAKTNSVLYAALLTTCKQSNDKIFANKLTKESLMFKQITCFY